MFGLNLSLNLHALQTFFLAEEERARDTPHVPVDRTIEDIRAEDIKAAEQYKNICEEDEECVVTGLESATQVLEFVLTFFTFKFFLYSDWGEANFEPKLKENIEKAQYIRLRKIQSLAIPLIMDGLNFLNWNSSFSNYRT